MEAHKEESKPLPKSSGGSVVVLPSFCCCTWTTGFYPSGGISGLSENPSTTLSLASFFSLNLKATKTSRNACAGESITHTGALWVPWNSLCFQPWQFVLPPFGRQHRHVFHLEYPRGLAAHAEPSEANKPLFPAAIPATAEKCWFFFHHTLTDTWFKPQESRDRGSSPEQAQQMQKSEHLNSVLLHLPQLFLRPSSAFIGVIYSAVEWGLGLG